MKCVKYPFEFQEGTWAFFPNTAASKGLFKCAVKNFVVCVELWQKLRVPLKLRVDLRDPLVSSQGSQISFGFVRGTSAFLLHRCGDE